MEAQPKAWVRSEGKEGKVVSASWGLVAAEENRGGRFGGYSRGGRRKVGSREGPAAMFSH